MNFFKACAPVVLAAIAGCTVIPGSDMNRMNSGWFDNSLEDYPPATTEINYIPINATVISQLKQASPKIVPSRNIELEKSIQNYTYEVGPGDVLTITVWEHPELTIPSGAFRSPVEGGNEIKADGTLFYPYAGNLQVAGLTARQIQTLLQERLGSVIKSPQVDVRVVAYRNKKVFVSGAVESPGVFPIDNTPMTLIEVLERAGGIKENAEWGKVTVARGKDVYPISVAEIYENGLWTKNILLEDGDLVHISRNDAYKIFILGEVNRPQSIMMSRNGTSLAEALSSANGIIEGRADGRGIYVLRNAGISKDKNNLPVYNATVYHLNASSAIGFMLADNFQLKPRDVVYVAPAPITRWNRFLSTLLPSLIVTDRFNDIESAN